MIEQVEKARGSAGDDSPPNRIVKACKKRKYVHLAFFAFCVITYTFFPRGGDAARDNMRNMALIESLPIRLDVIESSSSNSLEEPSLLEPEPDNHNMGTLESRNIVDNPLFVLSFANHGNLALSRYFRCAGLDSNKVGRTWTQTGRHRENIGACMDANLHNTRNKTLVNARKRLGAKAILNGCGNFQVWSEMEYVSHRAHSNPNGTRECFFPALQPKVLEQLFQAYPTAEVLNVVRDPDEWYQTLSPQEKKRWPRWCNANHGNAFPQGDAPKEEWITFYQNYQKTLREAVAQHPSVTYIEVDLENKPPEETALMLQEQLGLSPKCWTDVAVKPGLPKQLTFPIFVPSLPKSATSTSHSFLNCGLGRFEGSHQWTAYEDTAKQVTVGECWQNNMRNNRPVLENCGDQKHWSDFGVESQKRDTCFYPTIHDDGLEALYRAHPYATILHTTRDAKNWYKSALKWMTVLERWSRNCDGFPKAAPTAEAEWTQFYDWHTNHVREFARNHPTMTYVEIQVEDHVQTQNTLDDNFGFPKKCWGHRNINEMKG